MRPRAASPRRQPPPTITEGENALLRHTLALAAAIIAAPVAAHAPAIGANGGLRLHWGSLHYELIPGPKAARLFITTAAADKPVDASKASATGRMIAGGRLVPLAFAFAGGNRLEAPVPLTGDWRVQLAVRTGSQAATLTFTAAQLRQLARARGAHGGAGHATH